MNVEDYTQALLEDEGTFRLFPVSWTLEKYDSGAVALAMRLAVSRKWHGKEAGWSEEYAPGWYTEHRAWIVVKAKDKQGNVVEGAEPVLSEKTIKRLNECGVWDGDFDKVEGPPPAVFVLGDVSAEEHEGKQRYRCDWINPNADEPKPRGSFAPVDRGLLDQLRAKHGAKTRALTAPAPGKGPAAQAPPPNPAAVAAPAPAQPAPAVAPAAAPAPAPAPTPQAAPVLAPAAPAAPSLPAPGAPTAGAFQPPAWGGGGATASPGAPPVAAPQPEQPPATSEAVEPGEIDPGGVPF